MKLSSVIAGHPVLLFTFLIVAVMLLPSLLIAWCHNLAKEVKQNADMNVERLHYGLVSEIENLAKMLQVMNSSVVNLASIMSPLMANGSRLLGSYVRTKVAPLLFQAFSTIPMVSQVSFIDLEGPSYSYYNEGNTTYAMYSSSTSSRHTAASSVAWNKRAVDAKTGKPLGLPVRCKPFSGANTSWINETLSSAHGWHASLGSGWNTSHDPLFLNSVRINARAIISVGFSAGEAVALFSGISLFDGSLYLATLEGQVLLGGIPNTSVFVKEEYTSLGLVQTTGVDQIHLGDVSCLPNTVLLSTSVFSIGEREYDFYCSPIQIFGVQSVYAMAMPRGAMSSRIQKRSQITFALAMVMMAILFISILSFILLMVSAARREMHLRSSLVRQTEFTQQAERKSMNKSNAFARASHDIRNALASISSWVEFSIEEVDPISNMETKSKLENHLTEIQKCTIELGATLNSVLDISKIEAGKMALEEEEFDVADLLEHAVDIYYPVGIQKKIDVVLDLCDDSVVKYRLVKGDREKLKKILWNLLSNAVKFTVEGHVSVRARARKPSLEDKMIASPTTQVGSSKKSSQLCWRNREDKGEEVEVEVGNPVKQSPNCMEFVFEVEDTGIGIPTDKRESVFENYVQVKEKTLQVEGTGLGLGIVQSLVRLMGGEIEIVDKQNAEQGTCFRFNVFLIAQDNPAAADNRGDIESRGDSLYDSTREYLGLTIRTRSGLASCTPSPRLTKLRSSPKVESSHVVLFMSNKERCRVSQKYIEANGIKVSVVEQLERLYPTLRKIKRKYHVSPHSSSGKSDLDSWSESSSTKSKEFPLSAMEGVEQKLPVSRSATSRRGPAGFVLLVIDAKAGDFQELDKAVAEFKRGLSDCCCKVVWLDRPTLHSNGIDNKKDISLIGPFHGTRLHKVLKLLPEFGGASSVDVVDQTKKQSSVQNRKGSNVTASSSGLPSKIKTRPDSGARPKTCRHAHKREIQSEDSSSGDSSRLVRIKASPSGNRMAGKQPSCEVEPDKMQLLSGSRFLLVDDLRVLRLVANRIISKLGAIVHDCENGQIAVQLVREGFQQQQGPSYMPPYDYILMDCQMDVMDGYEATKRIRKEEERYGVYIPIFGLSANTSEEFCKMEEAGMDVSIEKPLSEEKLIDALNIFRRK